MTELGEIDASRCLDDHGDDASGTTIDIVFGFTSREFDKDSDLQYTRSRWHDAKQGRWTQEDPICDDAGNTTQWTYDGLGRVKEERNEFNVARNYEYDLVGNLKKLTDRNGRITEYNYDRLYRRTQEFWKNGTTTVNTLNWAFDVEGRNTAMFDNASIRVFGYDNLDRVVNDSAQVFGAANFVGLTRAYDAASRQTSLKTQRGTTLDFENVYTYDDMNRLTQVTQQSQSGGTSVAPKTVTFDYFGDSQLQRVIAFENTSATGTQMYNKTFNYDGAGRFNYSEMISFGGSLQFISESMKYDRLNRLTEINRTDVNGNDTSLSDTVTYAYDRRDQLLSVTHTASGYPNENFTFDGTGNRTMSGYSTPSGNDNRLLSDGTYSYLYDAEGNLTEKRLGSSTGTLVGRYTWDHRNRLTKVEIFNETTGAAVRTVTHAYDLNNRRISRFVDEGSNGSIENRDYFYYDGDNVALTLAQNMNVEHRYLHGPMVDQILADEAFDESTGAFIDTYWPITDHQGSVRDVLSAPGVRSEHIRYSGFGQIVEVRNGSTVDPTKTPTVSYAYTGREWDPAINLQYNRNRWYDPSTGRWISQDPIGFRAGDKNLYRYVENGPVNRIDPSGLATYLLFNPNSTGGSGHFALLISDANWEWNYFSYEGIASSCGCYEKNNSKSPLKRLHFKNLTEAEKTLKGLGYKFFIDMGTTPQEDSKIFQKAESYENQEYKVAGNNCANMTLQSLKEGGKDLTEFDIDATCSKPTKIWTRLRNEGYDKRMYPIEMLDGQK